jgi:hypothetical protein
LLKSILTFDLSLADIASKFGIPSPHTLHKWVKIYTDSGYNDDIFNAKKGRTKSIISDISKVPPFIYESAGIVRNDSNNSNDYASLKKKLEYEDEINFLKKNTIKTSNIHW